IVQTSDTTWQAYNQYGGEFGKASLYCADQYSATGGAPFGGPLSSAGTEYSCATRAAKVRYNRPFDTPDHDPQRFLLHAEYPMLRFLERNGYDVKYVSGVDTDRLESGQSNATLKILTGATKPAVFLSSGHDEYWSAGQRASVEAARAAGVHLA